MELERTILLIDDNAGDVRLFCETIKELGSPRKVVDFSRGEDALEYMHGMHTGEIGLIVLDLNLPLRSGMSILSELKSNGELSSIPLIVFTSSKSLTDIELAYDAGANGYIVKPMEYAEFKKTIWAIDRFWMEVNLFPLQQKRFA